MLCLFQYPHFAIIYIHDMIGIFPFEAALQRNSPHSDREFALLNIRLTLYHLMQCLVKFSPHIQNMLLETID